MKYQPIENYGVIGNQRTVALVGMDGSIDFLCFPNFDSPSLFCALLDHEKGGSFKLGPVKGSDSQKQQMYLPDSNILLSRFLFEDGVAEISDFMPVDRDRYGNSLVRRVKSINGEISFRMVLDPRFDYGRSGHRLEKKGDGELIFTPESSNCPAIRLRLSESYKVDHGKVVSEFSLKPGASAVFILEEAIPGQESPSTRPDFSSQSFVDTLNYWRRWISRSKYDGRWMEMVNRSALILKLLIYQPTGSIVAAPTFGLPEVIEGKRNWDYRLTWIRDASFTLYALIRLGYTDEAAAFMRWIEDRCDDLDPDGSLHLMYRIDGSRELSEEVLSHFEGYRESSPVLIGNAAADQLQLDIYGELMDSVYLYDKYGEPISYDLWKNLVRLLSWVCRNWDQPDEGIWEVRGGRKDFLFSRIMCWVALDRGIRLAQKRSFPAPLTQWMECRNAIYHQVFEHFWDHEVRTFVQSRGVDVLDASTLLMPLVRFISAVDRRWLSTLQAIERNLVYDSLVYRYRVCDGSFDGLVGEEGTFNMCSFWLVECLSRSGDLSRARFLFEKMLGYSNHLGLYAEELGRQGQHLGNFPQAFTHLALISAAYDLDKRLSRQGRFER